MINLAPTQRVMFFRTKLGWMGLGTHQGKIQKLSFGDKTRDQAARRFDLAQFEIVRPNDDESVWINELQKYSAGEEYNFRKLPLGLSRKTEFQKAVIKACRKIPHGETASYGQLAEKAGSPRAARAVGTVMSQNSIPLIIPCHRVVASGGLGGFSNPRGVSQKLELLRHEGNDFLAQQELAFQN